jgi:hypothetical protein
MIVGRVLLYDRMYYHHKVRSGEAMVRRLVALAEEERGSQLTLDQIYQNLSDDGMIAYLSGEMHVGGNTGGRANSLALAQAIQMRHLYHRAYAFAERFIAGLDGLSTQEKQDTAANLWLDLLDQVVDTEKQEELAKQIFETAQDLAEKVAAFAPSHGTLRPEHVLVDLPRDKVAAPGDIFTRTEVGGLTPANLYFDPDKWSKAYKNQKQVGFVFAPREHLSVVSAACRIVLFERLAIIMGPEAHRLCKTEHLVNQTILNEAVRVGICSPDCVAALTTMQPRLLPIRESDIPLPDAWRNEKPTLAKELAEQFAKTLPGGMVDSVRTAVLSGIEHLCQFVHTVEQSGEFLKDERPDEKRRLQAELLKVLRARGANAREGTEVAGGETDVILPGDIIIENKVHESSADPRSIKPAADWQARRYSIALNKRVSFVIVAYKPASEDVMLPLPERIDVYALPGALENHAVVRFLIPWGYGTPSTAKVPDSG